jgi:hypothetical protein
MDVGSSCCDAAPWGSFCLHRQQQIVEGQLAPGPANNPHQSESGGLAISALAGSAYSRASRASDDLRCAGSLHLLACAGLCVLACLSPRCLAMGRDDVSGPRIWRGTRTRGGIQNPSAWMGVSSDVDISAWTIATIAMPIQKTGYAALHRRPPPL